MAKNVQFNLRIPLDLKEQIAESASHNGRSINAEAQYRLESSFKSEMGSYDDAIMALREFFNTSVRSTRLKTLSNKLNFLMEESKAVNSHITPSIPRVAQQLGYDTAELVEFWFEGRTEPPFDTLSKIADYFGCRKEWLIFGEGKPYPQEEFKFGNNIEKNAKQLISINPPSNETNKNVNDTDEHKEVHALWFVRNRSENGELIIVKHLNTWRSKILKTRVHVSNKVGVGGTEDRALLSLTLKYLCKNHLVKTHGALVTESDYDKLLWASENPIKVLNQYRHNTWVEDIWDASMYSKPDNSYWDGWLEMCLSNARYISDDENFLR